MIGPLTLFRDARIYSPMDKGRPAGGRGQGETAHFAKGALLVQNGRIADVGDEGAVLAALGKTGTPSVQQEVDCGGRCLIPGFVDPHTHLCFLHPREREFLSRLEGAKYLEILKSGGGILSSVQSVRQASEEELFLATRDRALSALRMGTTSIEIKSGYGLDLETELKQLRVIGRVGRETPLTVVPTFLGAHAVPADFPGGAGEYASLVARLMVPEVARAGAARYCDVFCEQGVFDLDQARLVLEAAAAAGLGLKLHADELHDTGGAALAASMGAVSADHLLAASDQGIRAMARAGVIAVLLPCTAFSMRKPHAPARAMIGEGLPVAIASDCNPGSSCTESMPFAFTLAVIEMGLSVSEALTAATLNAAYAVGLAAETGSLTRGKAADFLLLEGETPAILAFRAGIAPLREVYKAGERVWPAGSGLPSTSATFSRKELA